MKKVTRSAYPDEIQLIQESGILQFRARGRQCTGSRAHVNLCLSHSERPPPFPGCVHSHLQQTETEEFGLSIPSGTTLRCKTLRLVGCHMVYPFDQMHHGHQPQAPQAPSFWGTQLHGILLLGTNSCGAGAGITSVCSRALHEPRVVERSSHGPTSLADEHAGLGAKCLRGGGAKEGPLEGIGRFCQIGFDVYLV